MTSTTDKTITADKTIVVAEDSLIEQSQALRQQLREQRRRIKQQLAPAPRIMQTAYPRSMTMRFLMQRKALVARLATEAATLVLGARLLKSVAVALSVARIVRSSAARDKNGNQLPIP